MEQVIPLISDNHFETGFHVLGINPVTDHRVYSTFLDYHKQAKSSNEVIWQMAQWWTEYPLKDASYGYNYQKHIYETISRKIEISTDKGALKFYLNSKKDCFNGQRLSSEQPWAHLLIEQDFKKSVSLFNLNKLIVQLDFNVSKCENLNGESYDPSLHAAQLLWYLVIHDEQDQDQKQYGSKRDFFWFGIPIFDSRKPFCELQRNLDDGGIGTTKKLIYSMDNQVYLKDNVSINKDFQIEHDILPEIKKAYTYAIENGYMPKRDHPNLHIGYMNFGWECPGAYEVESTISNMQIMAHLEKDLI